MLLQVLQKQNTTLKVMFSWLWNQFFTPNELTLITIHTSTAAKGQQDKGMWLLIK